MKERPILFNTEMVKAILEGRKTQTRRVVKGYLQDYNNVSKSFLKCEFDFHHKDGVGQIVESPYGKPGDRLWVRETWCENQNPDSDNFGGFEYKADYDLAADLIKWKPPIFMPREASRILLEIKDIRVERVQEISQVDAMEEGVFCLKKGWVDTMFPEYAEVLSLWNTGKHGNKPPLGPTPIMRFEKLWDSINEPRGYGWNVNPWVWVVEFKMIKSKIDV